MASAPAFSTIRIVAGRLEAVIWYHHVTAALTTVVVLEQVRAEGEHAAPRAEH